MQGRKPSWRRIPVSELALLIALILAIDGLVTLRSSSGRWAMIGALVLGLLAGLEIGSRRQEIASRRQSGELERRSRRNHPT